MRLYFDTEFNGFGGALLSAALVSEQNHEWYEVHEFDGTHEPWVAQNVVPLFNKTPLTTWEFRDSFHDFIMRFKVPTIICDWHADAAHFANLLAGHDFGSSLDFACTIIILKTPSGEPVSLRPHNALADARSLRDWCVRLAV